MGLLITGIIIVILIVIVIALYNGLVSQRNLVDEAASQIDVQLQRRGDLLPNLLETVKGYAKHEQETFEKSLQCARKFKIPTLV